MKQFVIVGLDTDEKKRRAEELLKEFGILWDGHDIKPRGSRIIVRGDSFSYWTQPEITLTEAEELLKGD